MIVYRISRITAAVLSSLVAVNTIAASAESSRGSPEKSTCSISVPFTVKDKKGWIPDGTVFSVKLSAQGDAPLPEKTLYTVDVSGSFEFGPIIFDEPDNYEYTISEVAYDDSNVIFDKTIYRLHAVTIYNEDGELVCGFSLTDGTGSAKPADIEFDNDYVKPPSEHIIETDDSQKEQDVEPDSSEPPPEPASGADSRPPGKDKSSVPKEESVSSSSKESVSTASSRASPWNTVLPPNTGSAVTIGISSVMVIGLAVIVLTKRRNTGDDEPPDERSG